MCNRCKSTTCTREKHATGMDNAARVCELTRASCDCDEDTSSGPDIVFIKGILIREDTTESSEVAVT